MTIAPRNPTLPVPVAIDAKEVTRDIRLGLDDPALMRKYRLSTMGLKRMFEKLIDRGLITYGELERRIDDMDDTVNLDEDLRRIRNWLQEKDKRPHSAPNEARSPESDVEKRAVRAKEVLDCIRFGMDEQDLMRKYRLSSDGLRSLFNKLVASGNIDVAELRSRMPGFFGVIDAKRPAAPTILDCDDHNAQRSGSPASVTTVNAREVVRDIRLGLDDSALMRKYHISSSVLNRLFDKLIELDLIGRADLDGRSDDMENTVDIGKDLQDIHKFDYPQHPTHGEYVGPRRRILAK